MRYQLVSSIQQHSNTLSLFIYPLAAVCLKICLSVSAFGWFMLLLCAPLHLPIYHPFFRFKPQQPFSLRFVSSHQHHNQYVDSMEGLICCCCSSRQTPFQSRSLLKHCRLLSGLSFTVLIFFVIYINSFFTSFTYLSLLKFLYIKHLQSFFIYLFIALKPLMHNTFA